MLALCGILTTWHRFWAQRPHVSSLLQWEIQTEALCKVAVSRVAAFLSARNALGASDGVIHSRNCRTHSCRVDAPPGFPGICGVPGSPGTKIPRCVPTKWLCRAIVSQNHHAESSSNLSMSARSGGFFLIFFSSPGTCVPSLPLRVGVLFYRGLTPGVPVVLRGLQWYVVTLRVHVLLE